MSKENYKEKNKKINSGQFMQENTAFLDNKEELNMLHSRELKNIIMKKDIEIARLKKTYTVKGGGTEKKVFVTFSKKNMK